MNFTTLQHWGTVLGMLVTVCPSLLVLPALLLFRKRIGAINYRSRYILGIASHAMSIAVFIAAIAWLPRYIPFGVIILMIGAPFWGLFFLSGLVLMLSAYNPPNH